MNGLMLAIIVVLLYIAWEVRLFRRVIGAIVSEMSNTRWERGVRDDLAREALEQLGVSMIEADRIRERARERRERRLP